MHHVVRPDLPSARLAFSARGVEYVLCAAPAYDDHGPLDFQPAFIADKHLIPHRLAARKERLSGRAT